MNFVFNTSTVSSQILNNQKENQRLCFCFIQGNKRSLLLLLSSFFLLNAKITVTIKRAQWEKKRFSVIVVVLVVDHYLHHRHLNLLRYRTNFQAHCRSIRNKRNTFRKQIKINFLTRRTC